MILYKHFEQFNEAYFDEFYKIHSSLVKGWDYVENKEIRLQLESLYSSFKNEFNEVIVNNLNNKEGLKAYVEEVYYNGVTYLMVSFRTSSNYRLSQLGEDYGLACNDDLYMKIENNYIYSLGLLANHILSEAKKHNIVNLKHCSEIGREDYNISGQYMALFKKSRDDFANTTIKQALENNDIAENIKTIENHLKFFTGKKNKTPILNKDDYERLLNYTIYLVEKKEVPIIEKQIPVLPLNNEFIRKTYSLLHDELYQLPKKEKMKCWPEFLHAVFSQFNGSDVNTTVTKFRYYTYNYEEDKKKITDY